MRERERGGERSRRVSVSIQFRGENIAGRRRVGERIGRFVSGRERIFEAGREGNRDVGSVEKSLDRDCSDEYASKRTLEKGILDADDDGLLLWEFLRASCF